MLVTVREHLHARSAALLLKIEHGLPRIMIGWLLLALAACAVRIAASPLQGAGADARTFLPYILLVGAPLASMALALRWFRDADRFVQPTLRLARVGKWRSLSAHEARRHPLYGTTGLMLTLLVGILLNVPLRTAEYLAAMPALSGPVPEWLSTLHMMMTLDVVLLSSLYAIAFVAALRRLPLFPRLLVAIWAVDLALQLIIATVVASAGGLPPAVAEALQGLLETNSKKALISIGLWLPYLLLSTRVNVTFRHRIPR